MEAWLSLEKVEHDAGNADVLVPVADQADSPTAVTTAVAETPTAVDETPLAALKHKFVLMSLHPDWLKSPMSVDVHYNLMVSVNKGDWHGAAQYTHNKEVGQWKLQFNYKADPNKLKTHVFKQIPGTESYLYANPNNQNFNSILITKVD